MRDGYRWQQPVPEVVKRIRNRRQYRQHLAEIRAAKARAKCRKEYDAWGFGVMTATEVGEFCDCSASDECRRERQRAGALTLNEELDCVGPVVEKLRLALSLPSRSKALTRAILPGRSQQPRASERRPSVTRPTGSQ